MKSLKNKIYKISEKTFEQIKSKFNCHHLNNDDCEYVLGSKNIDENNAVKVCILISRFYDSIFILYNEPKSLTVDDFVQDYYKKSILSSEEVLELDFLSESAKEILIYNIDEFGASNGQN